MAPGPERMDERVTSEPVRIGRRDSQRPFSLLTRSPSDEGAIIIEEDGVTLDLRGGSIAGTSLHVTTDPDQLVGRGIVVRNARNVTIRNARVYGYKVGIYAENAPGLVIENCNVSDNYRQRLKSTPFREHYGDWLFPHDNDQNEWLLYGAGIYVLRCDGARLFNNRARRGQNGICLVSTRDAHVEANDMSFLSGWGVALWRSSRNMIVGNRFDYCVRGFSEGRYERGQDSAGILLFEQSSENIIAGNSATHGGDGLFIYAGHETLKETGEGGCNRNLVFENDFSYAVMHGIESTFSDQNGFVKNTMIGCTNGVWAGYSTSTTIADNLIMNCERGIAIEHGRRNIIESNWISFTEDGVWTWWNKNPGMLAFEYCKKNGDESADECVKSNHFMDCKVAIHSTDSRNAMIIGNYMSDCAFPVIVEGSHLPRSFDDNHVDGGTLSNRTTRSITGSDNQIGERVQFEGEFELGAPSSRVAEAGYFGTTCRPHSDVPRKVVDLGSAAQLAKISEWRNRKLLAEQSAFSWRMTPTQPSGRNRIIIGEWGPCDYNEWDPHATLRYFPMGASAYVQLPHFNRPFAMHVLNGEVVVEPDSGISPALIKISARTDASTAVPFIVRLHEPPDSTAQFRGELVSLQWQTTFFQWPGTLDPRDDPENWNEITAGNPIGRTEGREINFVWGSGGPIPDGPKDRFAAVAVGSAALIPGRWRIRTMSDDGIRVYVDDHRVIDNWTWHVPTEDVAEFEVSDSNDHRFRIEYFELDGHAELRFTLESIPPALPDPPNPTLQPSEIPSP